MIPALQNLYGKNPNAFTLQQDNATAHSARGTTALLNHLGVKYLPWPGNSADLSPIENAWAIVQKRLAKHSVCNFD